MVVTLDDFKQNHMSKERDWLVSEVLNSLPEDVAQNVRITGQVNVELVIDGVKVDPKLLGSVYSNLERYIEEQAEYIMKQKMEAMEERMYKIMHPLEDAAKAAVEKIKEEFNIAENEQ